MEAELNKWRNMKESILGWYAEFPFVEDKAQAESYLPYVEKVLKIGEGTKVLKVIDSRMGRQYGAPDISYLEQVKWVLEEKQQFVFLNELVTSSCIAYFDYDGTVEQEYVGSAKALLERLRPRMADTRRDHPPLSIRGVNAVAYFAEKSRQVDTSLICFNLYTDIWFPYVVDWERWFYYNEEDKPAEEFLVDNRVLASEHTPRLNTFLEEVKALTIEFGGNWKIFEPELIGYEEYGKRQTDTGVRLDE